MARSTRVEILAASHNAEGGLQVQRNDKEFASVHCAFLGDDDESFQKSGLSVCGMGSAPSAPNSPFGFSAQLDSRMGPATEVEESGLKGSVGSATTGSTRR